MFSAISDLNGDKALRLDGFSIAFWQFSWGFCQGRGDGTRQGERGGGEEGEGGSVDKILKILDL